MPYHEPEFEDPQELVGIELPGDEGVTREMAEALYVALVTDTGSFRYSNTTPRTFRIAGALSRRRRAIRRTSVSAATRASPATGTCRCTRRTTCSTRPKQA